VSTHWVDKFFARVDVRGDDECWPWKLAPDSGGYGKMYVNGTMMRAHVLSFTIHNGPVPRSLVVRHTCDNPICVNPSHLLLGTNRDNSYDMLERGRQNNQRKTHCVRGHEFDSIDRKGARHCTQVRLDSGT